MLGMEVLPPVEPPTEAVFLVPRVKASKLAWARAIEGMTIAKPVAIARERMRDAMVGLVELCSIISHASVDLCISQDRFPIDTG